MDDTVPHFKHPAPLQAWVWGSFQGDTPTRRATFIHAKPSRLHGAGLSFHSLRLTRNAHRVAINIRELPRHGSNEHAGSFQSGARKRE